jgi:acetyl esterase/lipase
MIGLGIAVAFWLLLWLSLLYVPFRWRPVGIFLFAQKVFALAYVPFIFVIGTALAAAGALSGSWWIAAPAGIAAVGALVVMVRVGSVVGRWWIGPLPKGPEPRLRQNVAFATVPGSDRVLLCDVWQPPIGAASSGVAVIFLHGSAYYVLDKDCGTRPLFRYLTAQGHVIVDVAYRLFPETDLFGMVGDVKRAIAWVRGHAGELGIDPDRIVLAGASAGGHLALLAAYGQDDPLLTPKELAGTDLRVHAAISLYGQVGIDTMYRHTSQEKICHPDDPKPDWTAQPSRALVRLFGDNARRLRMQFMMYGGRADWLMGGTPSEVPDRYERASVTSYVRPDCPATLLMHGTHDEMAPVSAVRQLQRRLEKVGVPVTAVYLPHSDHMFDAAPKWSPAARVTFHVLERFLAAMSVNAKRVRPAVEPRGQMLGRPVEDGTIGASLEGRGAGARSLGC